MLNVTVAAELHVKAGLPYVSRGGLKLERALDTFGLQPTDKLALDIGASTGGFTDCLLQRGAKTVYAVDVGHSQLAWSLQTDLRVIVLDKTNIRYLEALPPLEPDTLAPLAELVVIDVSFISLRLVLPAARRLSRLNAPIVTLVKPQFEAGRGEVGKGGIIRDPAVHRKVLEDLVKWCNENNFLVNAIIRSPILGTEGNVEFLAHLHALEREINPQEQLEMLSLIDPLFETGKLPEKIHNSAT
jgi:23S rRNA (cytidine1920-2'-O)/16S rRNA (cytidine1409-2'-O)-methyltransferase